MTSSEKLIIVLDGGLVQHVTGTGNLIGCNVTVIDYDTDGADASDLTEVAQGDGSTADAFVRTETVGAAAIPTGSFAAFGAADPVRDAAPDMLAALRKALDDWPQFDAESAPLAPGCIPDDAEPVNGGDLVEWFAQWRETAKAAIAKAEGRANG